MPPVGRARGAPEVLVEVIVDAPRVAHLVERLRRDEQLREEALQEPRQDRARIGQAGKLLGQERPPDVGGILYERDTLLVAPPASQELVADQAEGFDRDPALSDDEHTVLEGVADVVVRRGPIRVEGGPP